VEWRWGSAQQKTCNISEMEQGRTKVTIDDQYIVYALSIGAKINDLG